MAAIPDDAPYSFQARDNSIAWNVDFHIDVASWPDWTTGVLLQILP